MSIATDNLSRVVLHDGVKLGRAPAKVEHRAPRLKAFLGPELPEPPREIDYLAPMTSIPMLANDRYGDCVIAAIAHLIQSMTASQGRERVFTDDEVLEVYSGVTGFRRDDPDTDLGTNIYEALTWVKRHGFHGFEVLGFGKVSGQRWREQRLATGLFGGSLVGADLPLVARRQLTWRLEMGQGDDDLAAGGWGGHAFANHRVVLDDRDRPFFTCSTWGEEKGITSSFWDAGYVPEAWFLVLEGWEPPAWAGKGFDADGLLEAMKVLT